MQLPAQNFTALIKSLGLVPGLFKPSHGLSTDAISNNYSAYANLNAELHKPISATGPYADVNDPYRYDTTASCDPEPYYPAPVTDQEFPPFDSAKATIYRYRQQQSVNLGSWFVHENWMSPSLFSCAGGPKVSELDIAYGWNSVQGARAVLERHWDTWIVQSDFDQLASIGINTVRLPIGYWSLGPGFCQATAFEHVAEVYQGSWSRVVRAINMAGKVGIGVLIDLHGAVGSQNGQGHSGISDGKTNLFYDEGNIAKTIDVLKFLIQQLGAVTNVVGIQMLNEPLNIPELTPFYNRAIDAMRKATPQGKSFPLYLHDGFNLWRYSHFIGNRTDFIVQDYHSYYVFTPADEREPASQHTTDVQGFISERLEEASWNERRNLVVDEWSCALTDQSLSQEADQEGARREFCSGQMDVYAKAAAGWSFWAYKKENCDNDPGWCFKAAIGRSLPSTFFSYGQKSINSSPDNIGVLFPDLDVSSATEALSSIGKMAGPTRIRSHTGKYGFPFHRTSTSPFDVFYRTASHFKREETDTSSPTDRATKKGYSDGMMTAKIFALLEFSKLGFSGQYVNDSIVALGPSVIAIESEGYYRESFAKGLKDGEAIVRGVLKV